MINRFKRLDLVDRVPEELWMEVCNTAKSLQSCPTLCDPVDGRQSTRLPRPWDFNTSGDQNYPKEQEMQTRNARKQNGCLKRPYI